MPQAGPFRVLVVEGDFNILSGLSVLLSLEGAVALQATNAQDALRALRRHAGAVDAALITLSLQRTDGVEVCRMLKELKPGLRCWLMADARSGTLLPKGFDGVLARPFTMDDFRSCLHAMRAGVFHDAGVPDPAG